jgi:hypothetical protein
MRKITTLVVAFFLLVNVGKVMALTPLKSCYSDNDCANGYRCVYLDDTMNSEVGYCAKIYVGVTAVPTEVEPTISCKNLWWIDNSNKTCSQKQFCGAYAYEGLKTFSTVVECKKNLLPTNCAYKKCGDANCDGVIDSKDLMIWMQERGGKGMTADFNKDGKVDTKDYALLKDGIINKCEEITPTKMIQRPPSPIISKKCNLDSDCGVNQKCYQPPMPECRAGMVCTQVMPAKYCKVIAVTPTTEDQVIACDMTVKISDACPTGYTTLYKKDGSECRCVKGTQPTIKQCNKNGDADGDGKATLKDYAIWKLEYNSGKVSKADFDCNKVVNMSDYQVWKSAFLQSRNLVVTTNN